MILGEVVGGGEAMAAGADDNHVIGRFGLRAAPGRPPVAMTRQGIAGEREYRIAVHGRYLALRSARRIRIATSLRETATPLQFARSRLKLGQCSSGPLRW